MKRIYLTIALAILLALNISACSGERGNRKSAKFGAEKAERETETAEELQALADEEFSLKKSAGEDLEDSYIYKQMVEKLDDSFADAGFPHRIVYDRDYNQVWLYFEMGADTKAAALSQKYNSEIVESWNSLTSSLETVGDSAWSILKLGGYEETAFCLAIVESFNSRNEYDMDDLLFLNVNGVTGYDFMDD